MAETRAARDSVVAKEAYGHRYHTALRHESDKAAGVPDAAYDDAQDPPANASACARSLVWVLARRKRRGQPWQNLHSVK